MFLTPPNLGTQLCNALLKGLDDWRDCRQERRQTGMESIAFDEKLYEPPSLLGMTERPAMLHNVAAQNFFIVAHPMTARDIGCDPQGMMAKLFPQGMLLPLFVFGALHIVQGGARKCKRQLVRRKLPEVIDLIAGLRLSETRLRCAQAFLDL